MASVGILGGTFNPPHNGHLACARAALRQLGLARVVFMPVHLPPHKLTGDDPGPRHRMAMCQLAAEGEPRLLVSTLEMDRGGPSYTADTLRAIHAIDPGVELTFILGADVAQTLPAWREPRELLALAKLAVADREGTRREDVVLVLRGLDAEERVTFLDLEPVRVSSSSVRERVARGEAVDELVPAGVAAYVRRHRLYQAPEAGVGPAPAAGSVPVQASDEAKGSGHSSKAQTTEVT